MPCVHADDSVAAEVGRSLQPVVDEVEMEVESLPQLMADVVDQVLGNTDCRQ